MEAKRGIGNLFYVHQRSKELLPHEKGRYFKHIAIVSCMCETYILILHTFQINRSEV